ncbi:aromatic amino acid ammonia-lyase [Providencia stuartii]|uniref:HAL/PAL/TAL family ammonia-lyase n=1 Tax=Providencia stuartii TaxID=588 RepID=UPI00300D6B1A
MIKLNGNSLTPSIVESIANGEKVCVDPFAMEKVKLAHSILIKAALQGVKIYGLTVGVGLNKDQEWIDLNGKLTNEVIEKSVQFNINLLRAHSVGVGASIEKNIVRALIAIRLNNLLSAHSGIQPAIINSYIAFLNLDIIPVIPVVGSVGEADITIISHVGLAMIGEGNVIYKRKQCIAIDALSDAKVPLIKPWAKDALSILSSNAYSAAIASLALAKMARYLDINEIAYSLTLQSLNGNLSPFNELVLSVRPYDEVNAMGDKLRQLTSGSSLELSDPSRELQDPLSFRCGVYILAALRKYYDEAYSQLYIQLNSSDDNPCVLLDSIDEADYSDSVVPSANFETLPWVLALENLQLALAHNGLSQVQQIIKFSDPSLTHLSRYLWADKTVHGLAALEKTAVSLGTQIKLLAYPVSLDYLPVSGGVEDIATNAPLSADRLLAQILYSFDLLSILLLYAAQAIDLRVQKNKMLRLSPSALNLYSRIRDKVGFIEADRSLSTDLSVINQLITNWDRNCH